jgi:hypothetical protein
MSNGNPMLNSRSAGAEHARGREYAESWTDSNGYLWLYGEMGSDAHRNVAALNDLWEFDLSMNEWAWMGGSSTVTIQGNCEGCISGQDPVPGRPGTPADNKSPGGSSSASTSTNQSGEASLFSGAGFSPRAVGGVANILMERNCPFDRSHHR